ncbi:tRNA guanosine(34) transglycosylase Tgt [candidate division WWE3 bacterium]|uniref:tRNA guanosine(34) transglycosylase Tgt n=1 Tax=candidate division WWE3 bacterium TaxID=2053526 RepID=A0A955RS20_UNCKA|nr:tRNA guanosine(34) transglycosylase Tgt [candidate division WWE3 bacterium]
MEDKLDFRLNDTAKDGIRRGQIVTPHGVVKTPAFVPDATYGAVRLLSVNDLENIGIPMVLGNSYHLWLRPGLDLIRQHAGLQDFMNWHKPLLTDSGGYQVYSLVYEKKMGRVVDDGIEFRDHLTGDKYFLTPEQAIENQLTINSDVLVVLDYPVSPDANDTDNEYSVQRTTKWAKRCRIAFDNDSRSEGKLLVAVIQGANSKELRKQSYEELAEIGFDGYAFGGHPENDDIVEYTVGLIPKEKLRYMMGSGVPSDIEKYTKMGWDLFDCVIPTRNARHGLLYTSQGDVRITNSKYQLDKSPVDIDCDCELCTTYTRAYLHHLFRVKEQLGPRLASIHNLRFYVRMMLRLQVNYGS